MSNETVNLSIPFDFLLQAIAQLGSTEKERLWEFLDEDLHGDDEDEVADPQEEVEVAQAYREDEVADPQEEAEVAQAYREYEAGEYLTLDEYVAQRAERLS